MLRTAADRTVGRFSLAEFKLAVSQSSTVARERARTPPDQGRRRHPRHRPKCRSAARISSLATIAAPAIVVTIAYVSAGLKLDV